MHNLHGGSLTDFFSFLVGRPIGTSAVVIASELTNIKINTIVRYLVMTAGFNNTNNDTQMETKSVCELSFVRHVKLHAIFLLKN